MNYAPSQRRLLTFTFSFLASGCFEPPPPTPPAGNWTITVVGTSPVVIPPGGRLSVSGTGDAGTNIAVFITRKGQDTALSNQQVVTAADGSWNVALTTNGLANGVADYHVSIAKVPNDPAGTPADLGTIEVQIQKQLFKQDPESPTEEEWAAP